MRSLVFHTRITELFGIEHPIIQAPMNWATDARLVAAVSEAGGLGTLGPNAGVDTPTSDFKETGERMRRQIHLIRQLTDKPFAVNFPIGHGPGRAFSDYCIEVAIEEKIPIAVTVTGSPEIYTKKLKDAGIIVVHGIASVYHARKAEASGADAVAAEGYDGGGHSGFDEIPTMALVPQVVDAVNLPVIAAGGISDARGFLAGLALGADGVYMGTRFMASEECPIHPNVKHAIVNAADNTTVSWGRQIEVARSMRNRFTEQYRELEISGASVEEIKKFMRSYDKFGPKISRRLGGLKYGDLEDGEVYVGSGAGIIKQIMPVREIVSSTIHEAKQILQWFETISLKSKK